MASTFKILQAGKSLPMNNILPKKKVMKEVIVINMI